MSDGYALTLALGVLLAALYLPRMIYMTITRGGFGPMAPATFALGCAVIAFAIAGGMR